MSTMNTLKVGAGSAVVAALLTGILTNGSVHTAQTRNEALKYQDRVPAQVETMPVTYGKEPLVSPAFDVTGNVTIIEKVPTE